MSQFNSISQARIPTRSQFNKVNYSLLSQQAITRVSRGCHAALIIGCVTVTAVTAQLVLHVGNKRTNQCQAINRQVLQHVTLVNLQGVRTQECLIWYHSFNLSFFLSFFHLHNEELYALCYSPILFGWQIKKNYMGDACSTYGERRRGNKILVGNLEVRRPLERPRRDVRIILKWIF
jgi:hypothetical protein